MDTDSDAHIVTSPDDEDPRRRTDWNEDRTEERDELLSKRRPSFWNAYENFRRDLGCGLDLDPDEIFEDVRDPSPGRDFRW